MLTVVDYGMGNVLSIVNMLHYLGQEVKVAREPGDLKDAEKLILPGVGSFDNAMRKLRATGFIGPLEDLVLGKKRICLGICLGMQLLFRGSEEGDEKGLAWIPGDVVRFQFPEANPRLKVPQMGWNTVASPRESTLFKEADGETRFYFVHSYHVRCDDPRIVTGTTRFGYDYPSAIESGNILGVQFHPEKSHRFGMTILRRYAESAC